MDQREFTVIGVMPAGFDFPQQSELWIPDYPNNMQYSEHRSGHNYQAIGLLKQGVSLSSVQSEMKTIGARLALQYPAEDAYKSVAVTPLHDELVRKVRMTLYLLVAAVALILLIACANIANLMLAKLTARQREIAIRTALGANRSHIVQQLLAESGVLAIVAGAIGLLTGWWAAQGLAHITPADLIQNTEITLDWRVASFALAAAFASTIIFGLAPAFQASNADLRASLHSAGGQSTSGTGMGKLRASIVVAEIAMSMALVVGAAILIRSLIALNSVDPGYRVQGLTVLRSTYPAASLESAKQAVKFYRTLLERAASLPGLQNVSATNTLPAESHSNGGYLIEGRPDPPQGDYFSQSAGFMAIGPGYFHTLGIAFISGRDFDERDRPEGQLTCIVNQELASRAFPGENPLGRRIKTGYDTVDGYVTIVAVVAGVRQDSLQMPANPYIYFPYQQHPLPATNMQLVFRDGGGGAAALRSEAHHLDPEVALDFVPLESVLDEAFAPQRFRGGLLSLFAGLALLLALAGLYGVMSYTVAQRRIEIGVRMALGAQRGEVVRMILNQGSRLVFPGVALGAVLAFAAGRLFVTLVYGVKTSDPFTFIGVAAALTVVALLAMYVPARRAAGVDPMLALRSE
jgi:putative ABC transport system permease protein